MPQLGGRLYRIRGNSQSDGRRKLNWSKLVGSARVFGILRLTSAAGSRRDPKPLGICKTRSCAGRCTLPDILAVNFWAAKLFATRTHTQPRVAAPKRFADAAKAAVTQPNISETLPSHRRYLLKAKLNWPGKTRVKPTLRWFRWEWEVNVVRDRR